MLQYLFFCCSTKEKDHSHTVSLEDINANNPLITKNSSSINCITQSHNNALSTEIINNNIKIPDEKEDNIENNNKNKDNNEINEDNTDNILSQNNDNKEINDINNTIFNNPVPKTHILTINNINNININIHGEEKLKNGIKFPEEDKIKKEIMKSTESIPRLKKLQTQDKENNISGENSKEVLQQNKSFISFSNITIKYNNNNGDSSLNLSDTEILSSCELTLMGELFFNKEVKIDRSCIKNNGILKNRSKKSYEIKFGIMSNGGEAKNNLNNIINNDENNINVKSSNKNSNNKSSKICSIKAKQKKKMQSLNSFSSLGNNAFGNNKNQIDVLIDLPFAKIQKKINENNNNNNNQTNNNNSNNNNNNESIILFLLKYDLNLDIFQLISMHDCVPVQLLLNYNFPLKFQQNYNILVGGVKMKLRITKNENNESIINIYIYNNDKGKSLKNYTFNPTKDKMPITIGRNICTINLDNISVSKVHAQIDYVFEYDEFFITDCNSTNGTYLLLQNSSNTLYIKQDLIFRLCESNFRIYYTNFQKL